MAPKQPRTLWDKIFTAVRNDPQKAGILTVLVTVLLVLQVRLQMSEKDAGPGRAVANTSTGGGPDNPPTLGSGGSETTATARPLDSASALRAWMESGSAPLTRNLFEVELERFPHDGSAVRTANK